MVRPLLISTPSKYACLSKKHNNISGNAGAFRQCRRFPLLITYIHSRPKPFTTMSEKTRYTDEELNEFKSIIEEKLQVARQQYDEIVASMHKRDSNDIDDTLPTYHALEEGSAVQSLQEQMQSLHRLQKFITGLQSALVRIENKTYGICRVTKKLIPKERLRAVPHATLSIEAKLAQGK